MTNILLYVLMCIMIFFSLQKLSSHLREKAPSDSHTRVALFGSLLFAAHPVHVEAVTWLSARKEVLQGFFFFLAFYLYLLGREKEGFRRVVYLGFVLLCVLLSILSKNSAVVFPAVVLLYEIAREKDKFFTFLKNHWVFWGALLTLSALFAFIMIRVMVTAGGIKPYHGGSFLHNSLIPFYSFFYSIKLLAFTINYSAAYTYTVHLPIFGIRNGILWMSALLLLAFSLYSLRWTKVIFFSYFFFLMTLLPYLNILPISTVLADRYVFIASFSYAFLLGILFDRLYTLRFKRFSKGFSKLLSIALFLLLLTGYSYMTVQQNKIWENSYTLWADAVEKYPESNTANALMGVVCMDLGMDEKAIPYLEKAVEILPYDYQSRNNLGIVYGKVGEPEKALQQFLAAGEINPENTSVKINLSVHYERTKEYEKAEEILKALLASNMRNGELHYRLALLYKAMGRYDAAITELTRSMELEPRVIDPYVLLGDIYLNTFHDVEKAKYYFTKGIEAAPKWIPKIEELGWVIQDLEGNR